jgi:hypothetical protein
VICHPSERLYTFREAARDLLPRDADGRPPHVCTVSRWAFRGVRSGPDGERSFLDHVRIGGRLYTSSEAISRFAAALTKGQAAPQAVGHPKAAARAELELDRQGF